MPVNPLGYPLDLQGNNPANFIVNEIRTFNTAAQRLFVPSAGPFYRMDFEIRNNVTNQLLLPNTDYKIVHLHKAAVLISGKNVNAGIYVHNTNIPSVRVSYRVIGGHFADTADVIRQLFLDNPPTDSATIPWDHVFGAPAQMPPVEHLHDMLDTYGYGNLITVLEQLRVAVIAGDGPAIDAIYRYIEILLTNSGFVTAQEVLNMINFDTANQVKVYATYTDLRAETELPNNSDLLYITLGKNTRYDGRGRQFVWSIASTDVDDNDLVVKPTIILTNGNGPGRLLSVLNVERDLKNSLDTLGRKINNDGVVLTDLATIFPLTVDLDTVVTAGTYWVSPSATNKPAGTTKAHLFVEVSETFVTQTLISIVQNDRNMVGENDLVTAVTTARVFTRNAQFSGGSYLWEDWRGLIDRDTLNIALQSLGRNIGTDYKLETGIVTLGLTYSGNLNDIAASGTVWFTNTQTNRPFDYGILETIVLDADTLHQRAYWNYREAVRLKSTSGWSAWRFIQNKDLVVDRNLHNSATDLDTVLIPDTYYYGLDCTNKPTTYGLLLVRRESDNIVYQEAHGADNTKHVRYRANSGTWTRWLKAMDSIEMERHGINTAISAHYTLAPTADVDTVTTPGKYYIGNTQINRPSDFGILEVELISGTIDAPGEIEQTFKCSLLKVFTTRRRYWNGTAHVWGNWEYRAMRNGQIDQIFNMESLPLNLIDPSHGVNAGFLATQFAALWSRLTANGIDADLGITNRVDNINLNSLITTGKWYFATCSNAPTTGGILEVELFDFNYVFQRVHGDNNILYSRNGYLQYGNWIWLPWVTTLSTTQQRTEIVEIPIEGYANGSGSRVYQYTVTANDISFEIRIVSAGGAGAGGGGASNNGDEDYGGGGGGGGGSGIMALVQISALKPGSTITFDLGQPGAAGYGQSGTHGTSATAGVSSYLTVDEPGGYGTTFQIGLGAGNPGTYGWAGGINSSTAGNGGAITTYSTYKHGFFNHSFVPGEAGGGGGTAGWQGGAGGYGGHLEQQCIGNARASGGVGSSTNGNPGYDGYVAFEPPYQFGRGGGGGGGGRNGSSIGGNGGNGGRAGAILRILRNVV